MIWRHYSCAALVGVFIAFGVIIASRISASGLGAAHVIVGCILTAMMTVKTTKVADSKR
jgi:hypothetical protein